MPDRYLKEIFRRYGHTSNPVKRVEAHVIHPCKHRNRKMMSFQNIFPIAIIIIICLLRSPFMRNT